MVTMGVDGSSVQEDSCGLSLRVGGPILHSSHEPSELS